MCVVLMVRWWVRWGAGLASGLVGQGGWGWWVGGWLGAGGCEVGAGWCVVGLGRVVAGGQLGVGQGSLLW